MPRGRRRLDLHDARAVRRASSIGRQIVRLTEIADTKQRVSREIQPLPDGDYSGSVGVSFALRERQSLERIIKRRLAPFLLRRQQRWILAQLGTKLPIHADLLCYGERFGDDTSWSFLLDRLPKSSSLRVLVPGCYMGDEDVQFWLRRGVRELQGIDVYSLESHWRAIVPALQDKWRIPISFRQSSIEALPFEDGSFNVMASAAVLEHVRNLRAMVDETARVLSPGGYALHSFGPLYYSYGADHCIAAYGLEAGYDHLLLDEQDYQRRIGDREFFRKSTGNPDLAFWALHEQFSFATAAEYIDLFRSRFDLRQVIVKISPEGLTYRKEFPQQWQKLLAAGIAEADLLIKAIVVVLQKPF